MTRLLVHVEGQTEERFVNEVIAPHLYANGYTLVSARLAGEARARKKRGGICSWHTMKKEVYRHLSSDQNAYATTFVDYYAMPSGQGDWPGRMDASNILNIDHRSDFLHQAILEDFNNDHPEMVHRFIPYVAMHEFEALLFSDCIAFCSAIGAMDMVDSFSAIRDAYLTPEHINDSPHTAPSKRIYSIFNGYEKVLHGVAGAEAVGLTRMTDECPVFAKWLRQLEDLIPN